MIIYAKLSDLNSREMAKCSMNQKRNPLAVRGLKMVAREGIEPPTRGFSVLCSAN